MEINPYQSPAESASEPMAPVQPTAKLRAPTTGLILVSGVMLLGCVYLGLTGVLMALTPTSARDYYFGLQMAAWCFLLLFPNAVIFYGTFQARRVKAYRWAMAAAILACIPIISPLMYFGIPLGIWMLVVLRQKDVRVCFTADK